MIRSTDFVMRNKKANTTPDQKYAVGFGVAFSNLDIRNKINDY